MSSAKRAINSLNGVWLLDHRIGKNLARFKGRSDYWRTLHQTRRNYSGEAKSIGALYQNISPNQNYITEENLRFVKKYKRSL